jgi:hypothetical protein
MARIVSAVEATSMGRTRPSEGVGDTRTSGRMSNAETPQARSETAWLIIRLDRAHEARDDRPFSGHATPHCEHRDRCDRDSRVV